MGNKRILIADDDPVSLTMLKSVCERDGFEVSAVTNGDVALTELRDADSPQLAILDWMMPGASGPDVCRALRSDTSERFLYLMLLTSKNRPEEIAEGLNAGADDFLAKPYNVEELRARIRAGMRIIELTDALRDRQRLQGVLELAGAVCHELSQPLQAISGYSGAMLSESELPAAIRPAVDGIVEQTRRVGTITKRLMGITAYRSTAYNGAGTHIFDLEQGNIQATGIETPDTT